MASVAVRQGNPERRTNFIEHTLVDSDPGETANLNYRAYWVGGLPQLHGDDAFMAAPVTPGAWSGRRLLAHLAGHLTPGLGFSELCVHTLWSLFTVRPHLLQAAGVDTDVLRERVDVLLDGATLTTQARRELDAVRYAVRLSKT
ncbi:transcriptional regulator [Embleya sp. NPDC020886]|uniref:transcriptional regulator n=1 Tax=Embleya sp. NPDC020886 TaxID=3363980 RepID=UPI00378E3407